MRNICPSSNLAYSRSMWRILFLVALVVADQLTKLWARTSLVDGPIAITSNIKLQLLHNPGVAFSLPVPLNFTIILSIIFIGLLVKFIIERRNVGAAESVAVTLLTAGAIGNLIDRIAFRAVTDFVSVGNFPVFNVADAMITISLLMVLVGGFLRETRGTDG